jgi:hypothetical protein
MMEVSALMKVSKNAFYRAILILWAAAEAEGRLASSKRINELACAALAMGCKFECSQRNYLEDVFLVNYRRISKLEISHAEHCILKVPTRTCRLSTGTSQFTWIWRRHYRLSWNSGRSFFGTVEGSCSGRCI